MARLARAEVFDPAEVSVFHCMNRCVRQCFLCGEDPHTGKNFDHRKTWLEERIKFLAGNFGIDLLGFAILSNHFHVVLRNRPDVVATWSDTEVARRWLQLCPKRKTPDGQPAEPSEAELDTIRCVPDRLAEIRRRLSDISWLMALIADPIARRANREDCLHGRFWQGRFRAVRLCDEAAVLAGMVYVDLNIVRAGVASTPEASDYTSVQRRIQSRGQSAEADRVAAGNDADVRRPDDWLTPIDLREAEAAPVPHPNATGRRASDKGCLPMTLDDYLELVDWTGRQMVRGKTHMPAHLPPILNRLGIETTNWLPLIDGFGRLFHRVVGAPQTLARSARWRRFRRGRAELLGTA